MPPVTRSQTAALASSRAAFAALASSSSSSSSGQQVAPAPVPAQRRTRNTSAQRLQEIEDEAARTRRIADDAAERIRGMRRVPAAQRRLATQAASEAASAELLVNAIRQRQTAPGQRINTQELVRNVARQSVLDNRQRRLDLATNALGATLAIVARSNNLQAVGQPRATRRPAATQRAAALANALAAPTTLRVPSARTARVSITAAARNELIQNRTIIEQQLNSLYQLNNDVRDFLSNNHFIYIDTDNTKKIDYYYRQRELSYNEIIDKLSEIRDNIRIAQVGSNGMYLPTNDQIDLDSYYTALRYRDFINSEITKVNNKDLIENEVKVTIESKITQERVALEEIVDHLEEYLEENGFPDPTIEANLRGFNSILRNRIVNLEGITSEKITELSKFLDSKRLKLLKTMNVIKVLLEIMEISIMGLHVNITRDEVVNIMNEAIRMTVDINSNNELSSSSSSSSSSRTGQRTINDIKAYLQSLKQQSWYSGVGTTNQRINVLFRRRLGQMIRMNNQRARIAAREAARVARVAAREAARVARAAAAARAARITIAARTTTAAVAITTAAIPTGIIRTILSDAVKAQCVATFSKFDNSDLLIQRCEKYNTEAITKAELSAKFDEIKQFFQLQFDSNKSLTERSPSVVNYVKNSIASLFGRYLLFGENMRFNDILFKYFIVNKILSEGANGSFTETQQSGIDAGGLRRDFITALTTELFEKKIFISRDGTKKFFLNPEFIPDSHFNYVVKKISTNRNFDFSEELYFMKFYNFIGVLLSFILVNECGIEQTLSLGIIAQFISMTPLSSYDYIYFLKDDFPEFSTSLFNLLDNKDTIEYACISYNDNYNLYTPQQDEEPDKDVTGENIEDYIAKLAEFMMTKTMLRKGIEITKQTGETDESFNSRYEKIVLNGELAYKGLATRIPGSIKLYLQSNEFPVSSVTTYMTAGNMSNDIIRDLKANFNSCMNRLISNHGPRSVQHSNLTTMKNLFISHVLTKPSDMDEVTYFDFMTKLLRFWSGSTFYKQNEKYKIEVNSSLSPDHLPQSHTCFFLIDLPLYVDVVGGDSAGTILFKKLEMAISNVEVGIGLAGGEKRKAKKNKK